MTIFKQSLSALCIALAAILSFTACDKDDDDLKILFVNTPNTVYFDYGQTIDFGITMSGVKSYSVTELPEGWSAQFVSNSKLTVKAPTKEGKVQSGTLKIAAVNGDRTVAAQITVATLPATVLTHTANCYMLSGPAVRYLIKATVKGGSNQSTGVPHSAAIVWQSSTNLIESVMLEGDYVTFRTTEENGKIAEGNAVIAVKDADGTILWSWHLWLTAYDPETDNIVYPDGEIAMTRNLGAMGASSGDDLHTSYGLFYQWGRKDPLIMSATATSTSNAPTYSGTGGKIAFTAIASDAETGTIEFATANPTRIITGVEASGYDWLYSSHDSSLWSTTKSMYDPCPYGWRVPSNSLWNGVASSVAGGFESGWTFSFGGSDTFYPAAGRRSFSRGSLTNVNADGTLWTGYYWSCSAASDNKSLSLYFNRDGIDNATSGYRAGGYQVRCVKE